MTDEWEVRTVEAVVLALVPEYRQVLVVDTAGRQYALTHRIQGMDQASIKVGQPVICTVTTQLGVVLSAAIVAGPGTDATTA